jgi:hypothetical protein
MLVKLGSVRWKLHSSGARQGKTKEILLIRYPGRHLVGGALAVVLAGATSAQAGSVVSTGLVEVSSNSVHCNVVNVGTAPVLVSSVRILNEAGSDLGTFAVNCTFPGTIFPGLGCNIVGASPSGDSARCVVAVTGSGKNLRVHINVNDAANGVFDSSDSH